ncbi:hypothetical protein HW260_05350 [Helicobacter cinaedi]|uniref:Outer membrane protein n=1 Tax=Helicobacter cinaedi CCUG 18818 = ATCC BAA-847 TaxID=537971 RepID=A0AAI8MM87_9HELI|nr:hypothetical protein [Helicobacter cinaedi]EFR46742.1 hypothetical protein HCCG_01289 [Helicobacter cinaedi CCUG 18818 = ATCC BAA-847]QOQ91726.1 hypothetical protein HW260_05350 [Helicobacter cinaedi]BAM32199.1 conserved hypothetical protein [Helicobacter cinaedi CCUG 18818 = ATCC BAA-847]
MKKVYVSLALVSAMAVGANAVEVNPFGHLGAFYHQGFGGLGTLNDKGKEVQKAYGNVSARVGIELGLGKNVSIGLGGWGAYPFYDISQNDFITKSAFPNYADVSDAYFRYDGGRLSFVLGRFDIGQFFLGVDGKNYTGVDWIYGNVQGGALNVDGGAISLWAYWRNSQLGAGQAYNRMGYELSSFDTYQHQKGKKGELVSGGVDIKFGEMFKVSPFVSYLTDTNTSVDYSKNTKGVDDILNAGAKAQLDLGSGNVQSKTTLRAVYSMTNLTGKADTASGMTFWIDEELRLNEWLKLGAGYVSNDKDSYILNYGDRARFYGYRGGMSGAGVGASLGYGDTWYIFGGIESKRVALDVLYSGGDYEEISAVGSLTLWQGSDKMYFKVGAGYVGTGKQASTDSTAENAIIGSWNGKWQNSALAFAKFGF